jgi:L-ascorbate metabolism protein UlaG (beta-lactamase superfamily)
MATDHGVTITWLGHAATKLETPDGKVILIDPLIFNNPVTPEEAKQLDRVDLMLISHGHGDNLGDAIEIGKRFHPTVICMNELAIYLTGKGVPSCSGGNTGGTQEWNGIHITMVDAIHSSSAEDNGQMVYTGLAVGFIIRFPGGFTVYHSGDTDVFSGMKLIGQLYEPDVAILPIGSHYTMGPREAAEAIRLLGVTRVIPVHYGTFPVLTGTPEQLQQETRDVAGLKIMALKPGESVRQNAIS